MGIWTLSQKLFMEYSKKDGTPHAINSKASLLQIMPKDLFSADTSRIGSVTMAPS